MPAAQNFLPRAFGAQSIIVCQSILQQLCKLIFSRHQRIFSSARLRRASQFAAPSARDVLLWIIFVSIFCQYDVGRNLYFVSIGLLSSPSVFFVSMRRVETGGAGEGRGRKEAKRKEGKGKGKRGRGK